MTAHLANAEMEAAVLGLCMLTPTVTSKVLATYELNATDFAGHGHPDLWQSIVRLSDRAHHADPLTLIAEMGAEHKATIDNALTLAAQPHSLPGHVAELKQLTLRRAWQSAGHLLLAAADTDDERAVAQAEQQIASPTVSHDTSDPGQLGSDAYDWMAATGDTAISTGFPALDRSIGGGLRPGDMTAIGGWTNMGKALALDTLVPTPDGWSRMGDLQSGDRIFGAGGKPTTVTHAWPVHHDRPCHLVTFDDGSTIVADHEHLWTIDDHASRRSAQAAAGRVGQQTAMHNAARSQQHKRARPVTLTTGQIRERLATERRPLTIPCAGPVERPAADLPLDPYLLGYWLGDGDSDRAKLTVHHDDLSSLAQQFANAGEDFNASYATVSDENTMRVTFPARRRLSDLGVLRDKHIPERYMNASISQRLALLQGLIDSDGHVDRNAHVEICQVNERLARDTLGLALSLGVKATLRSSAATLNGCVVGIRHRIGFRTSMPVCRLPRKAERIKPQTSPRASQRRIVSVEPVASVPVRCITVAADDSLFLVGEGHIATHNSPLADGILHDAAMSGRRCHLYLNEMSRLDRTLRLVAMMTGLSMSRMQTRELSPGDAAKFTQTLAELPFGMSDVASWSPEQIARHIRSSRWDLACVDILHNIAYEGEAELSRIVQMLAAAARASSTHLLVVCHLNEKRADGVTLPRPVIRDIRGSGMVKNLCANVLLLHRPQHREANDEISTSLDGFVHVDKARHGQPASAPVAFVAKRMRFVHDDARHHERTAA